MKKIIKKKKVGLHKNVKKKVQAIKSYGRQEIVIKVQPQNNMPTISDLVEPMKDGKKMALTPTWVTSAQLIKIVQRTPTEHVYTRPGKGGQKFSYVTGNYVTKVLNFVFGWNWDFEVVEHGIQGNQVWVKGKLTVKSAKGEKITKSQFGRADIKMLKSTKEMLDFGNDLKAATTDALKKCASMLGIASDIYGKMEYKQEANVDVPEVKQDAVAGPDNEPVLLCQKCDGIISQPEAEFSKRIYGKQYCRDCQKEMKEKK